MYINKNGEITKDENIVKIMSNLDWKKIDEKEYKKIQINQKKEQEDQQKKQEDELFNQFKILDAGFTPKQMVAICTVLIPDLAKYLPKK